LFNLARRSGAACVLFGSRSSGPIDRVHDVDLELTARLLEAGARNGILIVDHVVAADNMFRFMSEETGGWGIAPRS
jgi:DNA repair protein RadC